MKEEELKKLLEKYYNGYTSPGEEKELRKYFSENEMLPGFETEREIFCGMAELDRIPEPSYDFEERIIKAVDDIDVKHRRNIFRKKYIPLLSAAATVLLLIASYFIIINKAEPRDTYSDPQIAYIETMKILNDISVKLNKGANALQPITKIESATDFSRKSLERSASIISGALKKLEPFAQLSDIEYNTDTTNKD
jgi:hypothetical protein